ncbi:polygalacturonase-like [Andrographis paniculata]|uniref:polygalacturonase-like n=1 Tax=Andrographis paniculata TaxID=175694 RepID=UPI0021E95FAE|nr:polygalacturonase-like [Andrographis paniculata]
MSMSLFSFFSIILSLVVIEFNNVGAQPVVYNIETYGARYGEDIAPVMLRIWKEIQASARPMASKIVIPSRKWYLSELQLEGPNKARIELDVRGIVQAPEWMPMPANKGGWITIRHMNGFVLTGGGVFDGRGHQAWQQNQCHQNSNCPQFPLNLSFNFMNNSVIHNVTTRDSKGFHMNCIGCHNVTFARVSVSAPGDSPNTDGIHVGRSSNVVIRDSVIETGDDCVSIGDDTHQLHVVNVRCGPGHGISIGSLGRDATEKDVSQIHVINCTFSNTLNGVRVKTWPSSPIQLKVTNLEFRNLVMNNVSYPVNIDQHYCPHNLCNNQSPSQIEISNVMIENVRGSSWTPDAIVLNCSRSKPCTNVSIGNIDLNFDGSISTQEGETRHARTKCANVQPILFGKQNPSVCTAAGATPHINTAAAIDADEDNVDDDDDHELQDYLDKYFP